MEEALLRYGNYRAPASWRAASRDFNHLLSAIMFGLIFAFVIYHRIVLGQLLPNDGLQIGRVQSLRGENNLLDLSGRRRARTTFT
jgi:hypothetical protein